MNPQDADALVQQVQAALARKAPQDALGLLKRLAAPYLSHPVVQNLTALALKGSGRFAEAERIFRAALASFPHDPDINGNLANLLSDFKRSDEALYYYAQATTAAPRRRDLALNHAVACFDANQFEAADEIIERLTGDGDARTMAIAGEIAERLDRPEHAKQCFTRSLQLDPLRTSSLVGLARILRDEGDVATSRELFARALMLQPGHRTTALALAETEELAGNFAAASAVIERFSNAEATPWIDGLQTLARIKAAAGEANIWVGYEDAIAAGQGSRELWHSYVALVFKESGPSSAAVILERARSKGVDDPQLDASEIEIAIATAAVERFRARSDLVSKLGATTAIRLALALEDPAHGEAIAANQLRDAPDEISIWALRSLCWRLLDDPREAWLHRDGALIQVRSLDLAPGELTGVAAALRTLHKVRGHPLGQSVRGGTQTLGTLFSSHQSEIRLLRSRVDDRLQSYWASLGSCDESHPILRHRNRPLRFSGSWSVRLNGGGHHLPHIHPEGLISSACYLAVPSPLATEAGALEIGGAPPELNTKLPFARLIGPQAGKMVLFPSTLYHGTRSFGAGERLTVAFDAA